MPAQYFPFYWPYKIFNRIHLNFGVTLVALVLMLLTKIKLKLPITAEKLQKPKKVKIAYVLKATTQKTERDIEIFFSPLEILEIQLS